MSGSFQSRKRLDYLSSSEQNMNKTSQILGGIFIAKLPKALQPLLPSPNHARARAHTHTHTRARARARVPLPQERERQLSHNFVYMDGTTITVYRVHP